MANLLGKHAGGRDVEPAIHIGFNIGAESFILEVVDPIAVTAALLRAQLPDLTLREGSTLMARVASRGESHAVIVLAGIPVTAQVPPDVEAGATLKLKVQEVTADRVMLRIEPQADPDAGRGQRRSAGRTCVPHLTVEEPPGRRRGADGEPADVVSLAFNSPALGRLDLRLELRGDRHPGRSDDPGGPSTRRRDAGVLSVYAPSWRPLDWTRR